jgi:hypothetical protein
MSKFRKKPVVIEAEQFGLLSPEFSAACCDGKGECPNGPDEWHIHTLEGPMLITEGDWIIKGVKGEFYPCKPDVFEATYEPA